MQENRTNQMQSVEEVTLRAKNGIAVLILNTVLIAAAIVALVFGIMWIEAGTVALGAVLTVAGCLYGFVVGPILYCGLKIVRPNEAAVLTKFGRYMGSIKQAGFYYVSPFAVALPVPGLNNAINATLEQNGAAQKGGEQAVKVAMPKKRVSLKAMTLNNDRQKINDSLGNPIIIGIVVIWRVVDTAKAMFSVDNYVEFLSIQCDSALRNIVRLYPYDNAGNDDDINEKTLRGSSQEIAQSLRDEIQQKVEAAGLEVMEARITHLAYAPEIAAAMLQRQQASAIVDARQLIVEGAVGMVEMALDRLNEHDVVQLDEERKAAMVSNLMVVLCGNRDAQPVVNSGSLY